jgi:Tol biopolymer transport system component
MTDLGRLACRGLMIRTLLNLSLILILCGCSAVEEPPGDTLHVDRDIPEGEAFEANFGTWSPDGRLIAFQHDDPDPAVGPASVDELWIADLEAGRRWKVLPGRVANPDWSPEGEWVVFHSHTDPEFLFKADTSGQRVTPLTGAGSPNPDWRYAKVGRWHPSEDLIAFTVVAGEPRGVSTMRPNGEGAQILVPYGISPSWLPDGSGFVYLNWDMTQPETRRLQFYRAAADGSDVVKLTDFPNSDYYGQPAVSPDGQHIAFTAPGLRTDSELYLMRIDGTGARQVTEGQGLVDRPTWSPDGRRILFGRFIPNVSERLYLFDVETREVEPVFPVGKDWEEGE